MRAVGVETRSAARKFAKLPDSDGPIDTAEQEAIVESFEERSAGAARLWRTIFAALAVIIAAIYAFFAVHEALNPWSFKHHAHFSAVLDHRVIAGADALAALSLLAVFAALLARLRRSRAERRAPVAKDGDAMLLRVGLIVGMIVCVFWTVALSQVELAAEVIWLPVAVPGFVLTIIYVESTLLATDMQVAAFRGKIYKHSAL